MFRNCEKDGEWVQDYTRRGSPRQGQARYRWRSNREKRQEVIAAVVMVAAMILAIVIPVVLIGA